MVLPKSNIYFILVRTQFASNLGSAVRAMKNMGFEKLILVRPQCEIGIEARTLAMKGAEILDRATFLPSLEAASDQMGLLAGTTGRFEGRKRQLISCRALSHELVPRLSPSQIGIAFGPEGNGLRREELRLCQWWVEIPTASDYAVINLAQAVAIVAYELHVGLEGTRSFQDSLHKADPDEVEALLSHAERTFCALNFPNHISTERLLRRVRKITGRAQLEREDVNLLHGLLTEIERLIGSRTKGPQLDS